MEKHYFLITYFFFLLGFFVVPSTKWHNNFFYGFILFPYLVTFQPKRIQLICRSNLWLLSLGLAIYMCLTLLWSENAIFKDYVYYFRRVVYLFVFLSLTIELALTYPKFIDYLFIFLCWTAAITAIISVFWFYSSIPFRLLRLNYLGDQVRNPVVGASVYGMVAIVCCFYFPRTKQSYTWIYLCLSVVIVLSTSLTQSRGPLGALLITFLIGAVLTKNKKLLTTVLLLIIAGGSMFFYIEEINEIIVRRGFSYRLEIWQQVLTIIQEAPFFGHGISIDYTFIMTDGLKCNHPHNVYLGTTLYGGLIGLLLLLILQGIALWEAFLCFLREKDFTYLALLLFAFICIIIMNDRVINHPDALWIYFWLPLALVSAKRLSGEKAVSSFYQNIDRITYSESRQLSTS